jgi:hypothetical protein
LDLVFDLVLGLVLDFLFGFDNLISFIFLIH